MISWIAGTSLLIVIVMALRRLLKGKIRPWVRYALWLVVLARLVIPFQIGETDLSLMNAVEKSPVVTEIESMRDVDLIKYGNHGAVEGYELPTYSEARPQIVARHKTEEEFQRMERTLHLREILMAIWKVGVILVVAGCLTVNLRFRDRLHRSRRPLGGGFEGSAVSDEGRAVSDESRAVSNEDSAASSDGGTSGRRGSVPVYVTVAVETPCLYGLFQPAVYVTPEVASDPKVLRYAVEHEITHLRHGDQIWSAVRCLCLAVQWFNPLVWVAAALSKNDCELACDEGTIRRLGEEERADYGRTLIELTKPGRNVLLVNATTMTGSSHALRERIEMLVKKPKMAVYALLIVIIAAIVGVVMTFTGASKSAAEVRGDKFYDWLQNIELAEKTKVSVSMRPDANGGRIYSDLDQEADRYALEYLFQWIERDQIWQDNVTTEEGYYSFSLYNFDLGVEDNDSQGGPVRTADFYILTSGEIVVAFDSNTEQVLCGSREAGEYKSWLIDNPALANFIMEKAHIHRRYFTGEMMTVLEKLKPEDIEESSIPRNMDREALTAGLNRVATVGNVVEDPSAMIKGEKWLWNIDLELKESTGGFDAGDDSGQIRLLEVSCGLKEDIVKVTYHKGISQKSTCVGDPELYQLVRHARD